MYQPIRYLVISQVSDQFLHSRFEVSGGEHGSYFIIHSCSELCRGDGETTSLNNDICHILVALARI